ncbi:MAG TPA: hypothetical protein VEL02_14270 [Jatrophihabitantaceae bacterium]|nr:hypothetical protein [Jatrophihabitantaceae bacterium]
MYAAVGAVRRDLIFNRPGIEPASPHIRSPSAANGSPRAPDVDLVLDSGHAAKINTGLLHAARFGCRPNG